MENTAMFKLFNRYLLGYVSIPVIHACGKRGMFTFLEKTPLTINELGSKLHANMGHLNIATRMLEIMGWIVTNEDQQFILTEKSLLRNKLPKELTGLFVFPFNKYLDHQESQDSLSDWFLLSLNRWNCADSHFPDFLDGVFLLPLIYRLRHFADLERKMVFSAHFNEVSGKELITYFESRGWGKKEEDGLRLSEAGACFIRWIRNARVTLSYRPLLTNMDTLLFGNQAEIFKRDEKGYETHVDRLMYIRGSDSEHQKYFKAIEGIIIRIFNEEPLDKQPEYIVDIGCGYGTLLKSCYETIKDKTQRGGKLDQFPLKMIGIGSHQKALEETKNILDEYLIPNIVLKDDSGDPAEIMNLLQHVGIHRHEKILYIRNFFNHDQHFHFLEDCNLPETKQIITSEGCFVGDQGQSIPVHVAIQSLVQHFKKWSDILGNNDLMTLAVHCMPKKEIRTYADENEYLHFETLCGFTRQLIIEPDVYLMCLAETGLFPKREFVRKFPASSPYTRVTLQVLEKRDYTIEHPAEEDIEALMEIEKKAWKAHLQSTKQQIQKRIRQYPQGQYVIKKEGHIVGALYTQRIGTEDDLNEARFEKVEDLHQEEGGIIQLLGVGLLREHQGGGLGRKFVEFVVMKNYLKSGIRKVVGITLCSHYVQHRDNYSYRHYVKKCQEGELVDSTLNFHYTNGAEIKKVIEGYRVKDDENNGNGVLIVYEFEGDRAWNGRIKDNEGKKRNSNIESAGELHLDEITLRRKIGELISKVLTEKGIHCFEWGKPFREIGFDSMGMMELRASLNQIGGITIKPEEFFQYETPEKLVNYMLSGYREKAQKVLSGKENIRIKERVSGGRSDRDIAIIGCSCRFPGGIETLEQFWDFLIRGEDGISEVPESRWDCQRGFDTGLEMKGVVMSTKFGGFIRNVDKFDAQFFGISPGEAELMDPQQRILLELTWEAFEMAGIDPGRLKGSKVGVFAGIMSHDYELLQTKYFSRSNNINEYFSTGNSSSVLAGRLSYFFGFKGPSLAVNTACSSSLVAVHLACQSLKSEECEIAIAAGSNLILSPELSIAYSKAGMLSPDGRCKTFDTGADGYVRSEGCAVVLLKRLSDAQRDNDPIMGVILGSAVNQNGESNGLTAPNGHSQEQLLTEALKNAAIQAADISYVEAHGTGTKLGDPVEIKAIGNVYGKKGEREKPLIAGSVKSNIGHTEATAGLAGLIKVLLSMRNRLIPGNLHLNETNPYLELENFAIQLARDQVEWKSERRIAGISSFGFCGTNAHVILEEYNPPKTNIAEIPVTTRLIVLSARNDERLRVYAENMAAFLRKRVAGKDMEADGLRLVDIAYTLQVGRVAMRERLGVVVSNIMELITLLTEYCQGKTDRENLFLGNVRTNKAQYQRLFSGKTGEEYIRNTINNRELHKIAQLWVSGVEIDWTLLYQEILPERISLPTYPFAEKRYWIAEHKVQDRGLMSTELKCENVHSLKEKSRSTRYLPSGEAASSQHEPLYTTLYYHTQWEPSPPVSSLTSQEPRGHVLIFDTDSDRFTILKKQLNLEEANRSDNHQSEVTLVRPGKGFRKVENQIYEVNPGRQADYVQLIDALKRCRQIPDRILHLWSGNRFDSNEEALHHQLNRGVYSVYYFSQALMKQNPKGLIRFLYGYPGDEDRAFPQCAAVGGFARTIRLENSRFVYKTVEVQGMDHLDGGELLKLVLPEFQAERPDDVEIRFEVGQRMVNRLREFNNFREIEDAGQPLEETHLKTHGVYLITGGLGGLGLIFAEFLAREYKARLVLAGRSDLSDEKREKLSALKETGSEVMYIKTDISNRLEVEKLIRQTKSRFKKINGIIHAAGVIRDSFILNKKRSDMEEVLSSKVYGTVHLDEATREENLDFFVLFSSITGVLGNVGQCDYAYGNSFMDNFAGMRERLRAKNKRTGKTVSINWPLWKDGGMKVDAQTGMYFAVDKGMEALRKESGLRAFVKGLGLEEHQLIVLAGEPLKLRKMMKRYGEHSNRQTEPSFPFMDQVDHEELMVKIRRDFMVTVSEILKLNEEDIHPEDDISDYGFNSTSLTEFANRLNEKFDIQITPAQFYEHRSIESLVRSSCEEYNENFRRYYHKHANTTGVRVDKRTGLVENTEKKVSSPGDALDSGELNLAKWRNGTTDAIAIIGMSGMMPGSEDLESFWEHLEEGHDLISEIPRDRWDWKDYYGDPDKEVNKANVKWGGFIKDVDKFDALFFGISPREAELMDPQQRLFLETVWNTIEDAGYKASDLSGTRTGVFVGVATTDYHDLLKDNSIEIENHILTGNDHSILSNRVSYFLDLTGPSESIDTACSSSLVAIHRGVEAIQSGSCDTAIAGGVNVMLSPVPFIYRSKAGMLCEDGRCKTFDKRANGYVRGEGCGAVLLKPLSMALLHGDHIYAVIKGTSENHGGHANSLTSPNPSAQAELLINAYERAQFDPATVSYIETHGTGTALGDPVEVNGLKMAFNELYARFGRAVPDAPHCGIGSVKTNVGHLETAAGIAGVLKVLLALRHKRLPASIHFENLNPYIRLEGSPFYIVNTTREWECLRNDAGRMIPRRAGVSSFGFGGANAHIVLEEYVDGKTNNVLPGPMQQIVVLSARNEGRILAYVGKLVKFLEKHECEKGDNPNHLSLEDVAYTLQVGREAMEERLALVVSSTKELIDRLQDYVRGKKDINNLFRGNVKGHKIPSGLLPEGETGSQPVLDIIHNRMHLKIAELWVSGIKIEWKSLYPGVTPNRISLPTYPFEKERYWMPEPAKVHKGADVWPGTMSKLHPLIDINISNLKEQRYSTRLTGESFYLKDHVVGSHMVVPGVVYLEMARAAGELAGERPVGKIKDMVWARPIVLESPSVAVSICLHPNREGVAYEVGSIGSGNIVYAEGRVIYRNDREQAAEDGVMDIKEIQARCPVVKNGSECYGLLKANGLDYGPSFQVIERISGNKEESLVFLALPSDLRAEFKNWNLHPSIMDGMFQSMIGIEGAVDKGRSVPFVPFALDELTLVRPLTEKGYAYVRLADGQHVDRSQVKIFNIWFLDEEGQILLKMKNVSVRPFREDSEGAIGIGFQKKLHFGEVVNNSQSMAGEKAGGLREKTQRYLTETLSRVLKLPLNKIRPDETFEKYGIDSMLMVRITRELEGKFGELTKTLFFEYRNVEELAGYFIENHREKLVEKIAGLSGNGLDNSVLASGDKESGKVIGRRFVEERGKQFHDKLSQGEDIAIIGVSGRYPQAQDLDELWENLKAGRDCITEVPCERWDYGSYYDPERTKLGKTCSKWGGFISDVDKFDSLFFNIPPREAELIDPQERIFLEVVWQTLENAGYTRAALGSCAVGVFVGVMWGQYQLFGTDEDVKEKGLIPSSSYASIANRVSYFFDFHGPSIALDTMCSSSLTSIHMACESIRRGESSVAIAGGVNLTIHPNKYLELSQGQFASSDGRCRSFGEGGDGYVPGEGAGAVLLKPLENALLDGDYIYAVVKGTAINHGGKTNGYSVPNPNAQGALIKQALLNAAVDPCTVSYLEAHGTGTSLGDPVEITGLIKAYGGNVEKQFCSIGSIKSNIGHLESAAGIAGVTKVLLQMRHKQLVPSIHTESLNPHINFKDSPFYVQRKLEDWKQPSIVNNGEEQLCPRRAGISSFGAGGANAHLILEEYDVSERLREYAGEDESREHVIVISARNIERLKAYSVNMITFLSKLVGSEADAQDSYLHADIAYTLQVGREAMPERLALVVSGVGELIDKLKRFVQGDAEVEKLYCGNVKTKHPDAKLLLEGDAGNAYMKIVMNKKELDKLAQLWVSGVFIEWELLYTGRKPKRMGLPTYPFDRKRCWIRESGTMCEKVKRSTGFSGKLHPFIDCNNSNFREQKYTTTLESDAYYFADHVVSSQKVLPGVIYLEMARAAGELAEGRKVLKIKGVVWAVPIIADNRFQSVQLNLYPDKEEVVYEVSTMGEGNTKVIHSRGQLVYGHDRENESERIDIESIQRRCPEVMNGSACYDVLQKNGLQYGTHFQVIQRLCGNEEEALAYLTVPGGFSGKFADYGLHPALMDGLFQTLIGVKSFADQEKGKTFVPFAVKELDMVSPLTEKGYAYVRLTDGQSGKRTGIIKFDIWFLDEYGRVLVRIKDVSVKSLKPTTSSQLETAGTMIYCRKEWAPSPQEPSITLQKPFGNVLVFDTVSDVFDALRRRLNKENQLMNDDLQEKVVLVKPGNCFRKLENQTFEVNPECPEDYDELMTALKLRNLLPEKIIHLWSDKHFDGGEEALKYQLERGVYSVFYFTRALMKQKPKKSICFLYAYPGGEEGPIPQYNAVGGFARTIRLENSKFVYKTVEIFAMDRSDGSGLPELLLSELQTKRPEDVEIRFEAGQRRVNCLRELNVSREPEDGDYQSEVSKIKTNGVYVITGGVGGLGLIFAEFLAREYKARLVLAGRSDLSDAKREKLSEWEESGSEVVYIKTDISNRIEVEKLIRQTKSRFKEINGIIHAAGVIRDSFVLNKKRSDMEEVLSAKVYGTVYLDEATRDENLDFFILFSSIAAVIGNVGQCDYAYGNSFMDNYAQMRERLRAKNERSGKTVSINWPLWKDGGMNVDEQTEKWMRNRLGFLSLSKEEGIDALSHILALRETQVVIMKGETSKIKNYLGIVSPDASVRHEARRHSSRIPEAGAKTESQEMVEKNLMQLFGELMKVKENELDVEVEFQEWGIDSVMMMTLLNRIEAMYGETLEPNALVEHCTIRLLARYLIKEGITKTGTFNEEESFTGKSSLLPEKSGFENIQLSTEVPGQSNGRRRFAGAENSPPQSIERQNHKIAVIGMACRFPQSVSLESYWENLIKGNDMIVEIPEDRWKIADYYSPDKKALNKTYSKWGGFIDDIDYFDAAFFRISESDAVTMDPQHRILLELTQELLDRSGYKKENVDGTDTGVYIGGGANFNFNNKQFRIPSHQMKHIVVNNIPNMMAGRISDFYNLNGPSQTIDTACSSSLVAIHQACQSIRNGESEMAIAGGIDLLRDPFYHIGFSKADILSDDGTCYVFDERAKGIVLGEGAGLVFLKSYDTAMKDGDQILGVIIGTAVNNDGHTMGLTVPNLESQKNVIRKALKESGLTPDKIGFLEAHGTGTLLGDPIEIRAATQVYREVTQECQYCAVGSVKSNMGHLLRAAGIASFIKVILAMQHKMIPPSLHCSRPHPRFRFESSPFYPIQEGKDWVPRNGVRDAAISSFGFGGTNCHMILEEFQEVKNVRYIRKRVPRPLTRFSRKMCRPEREASKRPVVDETFLRRLLEKVSKGELTPAQAIELEENEIK